jgi:hypothetical protein
MTISLGPPDARSRGWSGSMLTSAICSFVPPQYLFQHRVDVCTKDWRRIAIAHRYQRKTKWVSDGRNSTRKRMVQVGFHPPVLDLGVFPDLTEIDDWSAMGPEAQTRDEMAFGLFSLVP